MYNLTLALDSHVVQSARVRAVTEGTTVSAIVRQFIAQYALGENIKKPVNDLLALSYQVEHKLVETPNKPSIEENKRWSRDELYDRPGLR